MPRGSLQYILDHPKESWLAIVFLAAGALFFLAAAIHKIKQTVFDTYTWLCITMMAIGAAILFFNRQMPYPLAVLGALILIAVGLFLFIFRGKDAQAVKDAMEDGSNLPPGGIL